MFQGPFSKVREIRERFQNTAWDYQMPFGSSQVLQRPLSKVRENRQRFQNTVHDEVNFFFQKCLLVLLSYLRRTPFQNKRDQTALSQHSLGKGQVSLGDTSWVFSGASEEPPFQNKAFSKTQPRRRSSLFEDALWFLVGF